MLHYYRYVTSVNLKMNIITSYNGYSILKVQLVTILRTKAGPLMLGLPQVPWTGNKRVLWLLSVLLWPPVGFTDYKVLPSPSLLDPWYKMTHGDTGLQRHRNKKIRLEGSFFFLEKSKVTYIYILDALLLSSSSSICWSFSICT